MPSKQAVLVIDMLNDFVTGKLKCDRAQNIIPNLQRLLARARAADVPVIYCGDAHLPLDFELRVWGAHAMAGSHGADVIAKLRPERGDHVVPKRTYSAFHETGLDSLLRGLGVETVLITGLHTNICDRHTAAGAFFRGYQIVVVSDCVDAFTDEDHREGLTYLANVYGAQLMRADELIANWERVLTPS